MATHEVLALVQWVPAPGIEHGEAMSLITLLDDESGVVVCGRAALLALHPASVLVVCRGTLPPRYYRNMLPELCAACCPHCHNLFYLEDLEMQVLIKGQCPFCRHPVEQAGEGQDEAAPESPAERPTHPWD